MHAYKINPGISMKLLSKIAIALAASVLSAAAFAAPINEVENAGFEVPNQFGGYKYLTGNSDYGWSFLKGSGVASNDGGGFNVTGASGNQAGFLQGNGSSFFQNFDFEGAQVSISFLAESRPSGGNPISVMIDNQVLSFGGFTLFTPSSSTSFTSYTSELISLTSGVHSLAFSGVGIAGLDITSFIDGVTINAVPEPTTIALLGLGLLGFAASGRKLAKSKTA